MVCHGRSLALSLTWRVPDARARRAARDPRARARALAAWDVASGSVDAVPPVTRARVFTQVPAIAQGEWLVTPDGAVTLPPVARSLARRLALMPSLPMPASGRARRAVEELAARGIVGAQELPLRVVPEDPKALDGWRFA